MLKTNEVYNMDCVEGIKLLDDKSIDLVVMDPPYLLNLNKVKKTSTFNNYADELMKLEEENLWKFKKTGDEYAEKIAYKLLHRALPDLCNGSIKELADIVFDYRFNMGSIENCSFVYEKMIDEAKELRKLYENGNCEFLTLSSVGPAFMAMVKDEKQKEIWIIFLLMMINLN